MKPIIVKDRKLKVMKTFILQFVIISLLFTHLSYAQRINKISGSRYVTEPIEVVVDIENFDNFFFGSSSYIGGDILIHSADVEKPIVKYTKYLKAPSKSKAEEFAEYLSMEVEKQENELALFAQSKPSPPWRGSDWSGQVNIEVTLPQNSDLKITVRTTLFDITVTGPFADVEIDNDLGSIFVSKISRKVKISSDNGIIKIEGCTGPISARTSNRSISLYNADSKLGTIKLRNKHGKILLEKVTGELDIRTNFAAIIGSGIKFTSGRSRLKTENSNIDLEVEQVDSDLSLSNENGTINLMLPANISGDYDISVGDGGRIFTKDILIKTENVSRNRLIGTSHGGQYKIDLDMRGVGTIELFGRAGDI